ncbi:MAG: tRNA epoxyqueuosine(34) reductase QueG [Deltaproteobacteria bacterium RIFOXYA12_FULL_58_15]|nr:MAG: tRNA epoxyqueuosine(34) reductase QueG [Deltaproteobacteria bacterium RIFOXYA12_FULL_58_15]
MSATSATVLAQIQRAAHELGFARVGICNSSPFVRGEHALRQWLSAGHHATMDYMAEHDRGRLETVMPTAASLICVALAYPGPETASDTVAAYARGADYHQVLRERLNRLSASLTKIIGHPVHSRACVDSAPLLEREAAMRAGIAFVGKSTMAIVPDLGSHILLGELVTDVLLPTTPSARARCGRCTACLDACPTRAFPEAFVLDARRCVSYLTIEHKGPIPRDLRAAIGTRIFGCDICQQACPYNGGSRSQPGEPAFAPRRELTNTTLADILHMGSKPYRRLVARSPLARVSRNQMARNAAIALGNGGDPKSVPALANAAVGHKSPLVRSHATWALGRFTSPQAQAALEDALCDNDLSVREEARVALTTTEEC